MLDLKHDMESIEYDGIVEASRAIEAASYCVWKVNLSKLYYRLIVVAILSIVISKWHHFWAQ